MPGFKRTRYLTCFYCGRKTSTPYDGRIRQFECPSCDATNYLDKNGDITDPPVSATEAATPRTVNYAVPRAISSRSSPSRSVFCETCLKNQHLVTASLAQYLPEDPDAPDYAELERKYYKFRKGLEQRYPQICADCEPKVRQRIELAAYTAKTDVLRRMIDRTEKNRTARQRSPLYLFDRVGGWLRVAGLLLQLLWHTTVLYSCVVDGLAAQGDVPWLRHLSLLCPTLFALLPSPDRLIRWSFMATACGLWWNPRFVQTVRGFTKHIVGLPNWYMYQAMLAVMRLASMKVLSSIDIQTSRLSTLVGSHLLMMAFSFFIYKLSGVAIRTDTTPLFASNSTHPSRPHSASAREAADDNKKNMSEILDEILQSPSAPTEPGNKGQSLIDRAAFQASPINEPYGSANSGAQLRSLRIYETPETSPLGDSPAVQHGDEMDWSPTQSKHRAFSAYRTDQQGSQGFGQAPTEPKKGHFWYRVPPAPTTPAQRIFNPPNQPRLRKSPATDAEISFRGVANGSAGQPLQLSPTAESKPVAFAEPSFFPPPPQNDPRNSLTELFTDAFTLTPSQEQAKQGSWVGSLMGLVKPKKTPEKTDRQKS